jgi:hypothetical protein
MSGVRCVFLIDTYCTVLHSRHSSIVGAREFPRLSSAYIQLCENLSVSQTNIIEAVGPRSLLFISSGLKRPVHETNHSPASPPEMGRAIVHFPKGPIMCTETTDAGQLCRAGCVRRAIAYCTLLYTDPNGGVHRARCLSDAVTLHRVNSADNPTICGIKEQRLWRAARYKQTPTCCVDNSSHTCPPPRFRSRPHPTACYSHSTCIQTRSHSPYVII